jgi:Na+/glutamate symporter
MNYVILIIAGVAGVIIGGYLGKKRKIGKTKHENIDNTQETNEQNIENKEKIN